MDDLEKRVLALEEKTKPLNRLEDFLRSLDNAEFKNAAALIAVMQHQANQYEQMRAEMRELKKMLGVRLRDESVDSARDNMRSSLEKAGQTQEQIDAIMQQKFGDS